MKMKKTTASSQVSEEPRLSDLILAVAGYTLQTDNRILLGLLHARGKSTVYFWCFIIFTFYAVDS